MRHKATLSIPVVLLMFQTEFGGSKSEVVGSDCDKARSGADQREPKQLSVLGQYLTRAAVCGNGLRNEGTEKEMSKFSGLFLRSIICLKMREKRIAHAWH